MKSSIKTFLVITFCYVCGGISAQNIKVFFPQFIGKDYVFVLNEGSKRDTVQRGIVGETGNATVNLVIPEKYKGYIGNGSWSIVNGIGINFVIDNEDFSVTCKDSIPNSDNIFYEGSKENELMSRYENELYSLYKKIDSIFIAEKITENRQTLPPPFLAGMQAINREYLPIRQQLASDTSYAAFFWRTLNYVRGLGNRIYYKPDDEKDFFSDFLRYFTDEIDATRLYYSGLWGVTISASFNLFEDKAVWAENMIKILKRTKPQQTFDALSADLIIICEQFGWASAEQTVIAYLESSGRLPADPTNLVNRAILLSKVKIGDKSPMLDGKIPSGALLIFYESGCLHCQQQLAEITKHYPEIVEKGYKVISISTDESQEVYEYHSKNFPWPDKLCDFKGFNGENLKNFGVVGTPTIYLINENGIILDRQPQLEDIKALNLY